MDSKIDISIVVPFFNESGSIPLFYKELRKSFDSSGKKYEFIFIDDGSVDDSYNILKGIYDEDKRVEVIKLRKNFGQSAALSAGFDHARGDVIITMDGDLQSQPRDALRVYNKISEEGWDIVSGWRKNRRDNFLTRRLPSLAANWTMAKISGVPLHDFGATLKAYKRDVIKNVQLYGELHRFIPALAAYQGIKVTEILIDYPARKFGESKYGLGRTFKVVFDLVIIKFLNSYLATPLRFFGSVGSILVAFGILLGLKISYEKIILDEILGNKPALFLVVLLIVVGIQFVFFGLLAEILTRVYYEATKKSIYSIDKVDSRRK